MTEETRVRTTAKRYFGHRFTILFAVLLMGIVGHAPVGMLLPVANPLDWLLGASLVVVVLSAWRGRLRWVLGVLTVGFLAARLLDPFLDHPAPLRVSQVAVGLVCLLTAGVAVRRALSRGPVDFEHIAAALDAYLLVGLAFGVAYWLVEAAIPGSLVASSGEPLTPQRAAYFSFITQATVGYGDIVPIGEHVQGLVIAQGIGGQMYLAVLVARLVSLYSASEDR
jgi:hypothetical protein